VPEIPGLRARATGCDGGSGAVPCAMATGAVAGTTLEARDLASGEAVASGVATAGVAAGGVAVGRGAAGGLAAGGAVASLGTLVAGAVIVGALVVGALVAVTASEPGSWCAGGLTTIASTG